MSATETELVAQLRDVAHSFCVHVGSRSLQSWQTGADGLRDLASALNDACERVDEGREDEDKLLEGGGALFAHLLIGALGARPAQADGRLFLRVGNFGCFDPFEAVRHALDDDWPSEALRREVARAEAEATGHGPHARVVQELVRQVHATTRFRFESCDHERAYFSESLEVMLAPLFRVCSGESQSDVQSAVARVVRSIPEARAQPTDWDALASRLFPRLVNRDFVAQMKSRDLAFEPFHTELSMAFVIQDGKMARFVRETEIPSSLISHLRERAIENLEQRSTNVRVRAYRDDPRAGLRAAEGVYQLTYGDGFDASRLCLPALGAAVTERFGVRAIVATPHRDALLAAPASHHDQLVRVTGDAFERAPHALTKRIFRFESNCLQGLD